MVKGFDIWSEERKPMRILENQIRYDKLSQGINGVEWLILNLAPKKHLIENLNDWIDIISLEGFSDIEIVMMDALTMRHDTFYSKYTCNWWMAISYTLTYLFLLKKNNYDEYFKFLVKLENKQKNNPST